MTILDQFGRPMGMPKAKDLAEELAAPSLTGVRNPWHASVAMGMTPERLARVIRGAMDGDAQDYLVLAQEIETVEPHYRSVIGTRKLSVKALDIVVDAATDEEGDVKLADAVRALAQAGGFRKMLGHLLDGLGKGYSVVELAWNTKAKPWTPSRYIWRDPTFFQPDRETGEEIRLRDGSIDGQPLAPYKFLVHVPDLITGMPIRGGLALPAAWAWIFKSYSLQDWAAFAEVYGMPIRVGKYGPGATERDKGVLEDAVRRIGMDAAAILPEGMSIEFHQLASSSSGPDVFERLATFWDKQTSKAVLGQTMTTDDGSSRAQAQVHDEVRQDIREADARDLEETINRDLVRPFIDLNWGPQEAYPLLRLPVPQPEDTKLLVDAVERLVPMGLEVGMSTMRDKLGLPDPDKGEVLLHAPSSTPAPKAEPEEDRATQRAINREEPDPLDDIAAEALADWEPQLAPMVDPIAEALAKAGSYEEARAMLPELLASMDPTVFMEALAAAMFKARAIGDSSDG